MTVSENIVVEDKYTMHLRRGSKTHRLYSEGLSRGEVIGSVCRGCGRVYLPTRHACGQCRGLTEMDHVPLAPVGLVDGFDVVHYVPASLADRIASAPWIAAIIRLEDGGFLKCFLEGVEPEHVHVGLPVRLVWQDGEIHHCELAADVE